MVKPDVTERQVSIPQVFINGRFFGQCITGMQRYARETVACLEELLASGEGAYARWTLLVPRGTPTPAFRYIAMKELGRLQGHLWEQVELPWHARGGLLLSFGLTGPLLKKWQIVTVHDANVFRMPQAFNWRFRLWYRFLVHQLVARSPLTIAVSRFSAGEAVTCYGASPQRVRIATEGWQHLDRIEPDERILDRHGLRGQPFALAVSSPTLNKNFALIVQAIGILDRDAPRCVVAGAASSTIFRNAGDSEHSILWLGYVTDEELKALYQHASCFVFPSFYEGFGIPPLEAMSCGCSVLATTAAAVREVCGDAALYFDPHRPEELANRLREVFSDAALRARISLAGRERAALFSWQESARLNLGFIREALCNS